MPDSERRTGTTGGTAAILVVRAKSLTHMMSGFHPSAVAGMARND